MTVYSGAGIHFAIDDEGGTLRTLTGLRSVSMPLGTRSSEKHAVGDTIVSEQINLEDVTFTLEGMYDDTADTGTADVLPAVWDNQQANPTTNYSFEFGPEGNASGTPSRTGECVILSYDETTELEGLVTFRASCRANTFSISTFA